MSGFYGCGACGFGDGPRGTAGVDAAGFARIGIGGWPLALGGAYVALAEEPTAGYWNPAGLACL